MPSTKLTLETLEDRNLLNGYNIFGAYGTGYGTNADDVITVEYQSGNLWQPYKVVVRSPSGAFRKQYGYYGFQANYGISVHGIGGNDRIENKTHLKVNFYGGDGRDTLIGGAADDALYGGGNHDYIDGGDGSDRLYGQEGSDQMVGGLDDSPDWMEGGKGDDTLQGGGGSDVIFGGDGDDHLYGFWSAGYRFRGPLRGKVYSTDDRNGDWLNTFDSEEGDYLFGDGDYRSWFDGHPYGSTGYSPEPSHEPGNDSIWGGNAKNFIYGGGGDDYAFGGNRSDTIVGGDGADIISGHGGDDFILGGDGDDTIRGLTGNDTIWGERGNDVIYGGDDNDELAGGDDNDVVFGEAGDDKVAGNDGIDTLDGGPGKNTIFN